MFFLGLLKNGAAATYLGPRETKKTKAKSIIHWGCCASCARRLSYGCKSRVILKVKSQPTVDYAQSGAAILEMAIILPVLILMAVAVSDLARAVNSYRVAGLAAYEVVRLASRNASLPFGIQTIVCGSNYTTQFPEETFSRQVCDIATGLNLVCIKTDCPQIETNLSSIPLSAGGSRKVIDAGVIIPFRGDIPMPYGGYLIKSVRANRSGPYLFP